MRCILIPVFCNGYTIYRFAVCEPFCAYALQWIEKRWTILLASKAFCFWRFAPCFAIKGEALAEQSALAHLQASLQMRLRLIITDVVRVVRQQKREATTRVASLFCWWTIKDSNLGPTGYEPVALTN